MQSGAELTSKDSHNKEQRARTEELRYRSNALSTAVAQFEGDESRMRSLVDQLNKDYDYYNY